MHILPRPEGGRKRGGRGKGSGENAEGVRGCLGKNDRGDFTTTKDMQSVVTK